MAQCLNPSLAALTTATAPRRNPGSKSVDRAGNMGSRHPDFLAMNPQGTIPTVKDDDGHVLWESNAILTFLAQKHGWTDLYPEDLAARSLVDQYLHWHHRNAREASLRMAAPNFRKDLVFPEGHIEQGEKMVLGAIKVLERMLSGSSKFIAGASLTLADFACYMEFGQLSPRFGNLVDFSPFPAVEAWLAEMELVPSVLRSRRQANKLRRTTSSVTCGTAWRKRPSAGRTRRAQQRSRRCSLSSIYVHAHAATIL